MIEREPEPKVTAFIQKLEQLSPGDRARLKRNAGYTLNEARNVLALFYHLLPHGVPQYQEETYFLVSTLFPIADGKGKGNLGESLHRAWRPENAKGLDRRVEILLDTERDQLPFRLRQTIQFLQSCRVKVDWECLLEDLLFWNHPERRVQQRWARAYFAKSIDNQKGEM
jgi:CRISPR system Cascade subunit CasB